MSEIIASTYEIIGQIGAGGGGIVYLANHLRLGKKVVLKADKRKLTTSQEILRREVDVLKDLSHAYIPQVYDYFDEGGFVYTVMDYIEGESLDKPMKRGERFGQPQIVEWARELLEALIYLHSPTHGTPPHGIVHSDIKPSNVMLGAYGKICLIDYNIALALGEENVAGLSEGYASPEHYGLDFSTGGHTFTGGSAENAGTEVMDGVTARMRDTTAPMAEPTELMPPGSGPAGAGRWQEGLSGSSSGGRSGRSGASRSGDRSGPTGRRTVVPDARSDIYSLGATLYHLLKGERPAKHAKEVAPLSAADCSPLIAAIINKAMNPNPDLRYRTAEEMLYAFAHLRENDPRTRRLARQRLTAGLLLGTAFLAGAFLAFVGMKRQEAVQNARLLAEYSENALSGGDMLSALDYAVRALPEEKGLFSPAHTAEAQLALAQALGVYDLSDGYKAHRTVQLPAAPLYLALAPDGKTGACVYAGAAAVFDTDDGEILATLPAENSALAEVKFLSNDVLVYAGNVGLKAYDAREGAELWTGRLADAVSLSADGRYAAAVYKEESRAAVYDTADGSIADEVDFAGKRRRITVNHRFANPGDNLFALNHDGSLLGASFADGSLWLYGLRGAAEDREILDAASGFTHFEGGFSGRYFAFSAAGEEGSVFAVIDTETGEQTGGFASEGSFGVQADESGIYVQSENLLVRLHPETGEQSALVTGGEQILRFARDGSHTLTATESELMFYDANANLIARQAKAGSGDFVRIAEGTAISGGLDTPVVRIMRYENHPEAEVFSYEPSFAHDEARLSGDGRTLMLYAYDRFRLFGIGGNLVAEGAVPEPEELYDQQFRRDERGSRLEMIYNDGRVLSYDAADGGEREEPPVEKPDLSLYEEFFTDELRIESPLHGTPAAYDRDSGRLVRELEKDAYLTYVTQTGEYIVTEYIAADGRRFGLLLDGRGETLARLPYLCDVVGDTLYFDYPTGNIRKSRIYPLQELIGLARGNKF